MIPAGLPNFTWKTRRDRECGFGAAMIDSRLLGWGWIPGSISSPDAQQKDLRKPDDVFN
jgi:hypothetical protein